MSINLRLEELRQYLKITRKDLADMLGITQQAYQNYQNGTRDIPSDIAVKINQLFNISLNWLLTGKGEMFLQNTQNLVISNNKVGGQLAGRDIVGHKNIVQYEIDDPQVAALAYSAYIQAKTLGKIEELKKYLTNAGSAITQ